MKAISYQQAINQADSFVAILKRRNGIEGYRVLCAKHYIGNLTASEKDELLLVSRMSQRKRNI